MTSQSTPIAQYGSEQSPYLDTRAAAAYLGKTYRGFMHLVHRHGVPCKWIGARRHFTKEQLDKAVEAMTRRRRA